MKKLMLITFIGTLFSVNIFAEDLILVPLENELYKYEKISDVFIINEAEISKIRKNNILNIEDKKEKNIKYLKNTDLMPQRKFTFEDKLKFSFQAEKKEDISDILIRKSKDSRTPVYIDEYLFDLSILGGEYHKNSYHKGINLAGTYGITDNLGIKLNLGYVENKKNKNILTTMDYHYCGYNSSNDIEYITGIELGYLKKEKDKILALAYIDVKYPVVYDYLYILGGYETSFYTNKFNLGLIQNVYLNRYSELNIKINTEYALKGKKAEKIYLHKQNEVKTFLEINYKINKFEISPFYEFLKDEVGIKINYKF